MTAYRGVILGTVLLSGLLAIIVPFLSDTGQTAVLGFAIVGLWFAALGGTVYLWRLVFLDRRRPRSWLLLFLATGATQITLGFAAIAYVIVIPYFGLPPLPTGWGRIIIGMGLFLALSVPVEKAVLFRIVQHDPSADPLRALSRAERVAE